MRRNAHVRFGGRPAETHPRKRGQGAAGRPYTYVPTWSGFCYTAFVMDLFSRRIVGWATSSRTGHRQRGRRPGAGDPAAQAPRRRRPRGPGPPQRPRIQVTCPSPTPDDSSTRAPVASAGAVGSSYAGAAAQALGKPLQARGPFWRDGPWKDRDDPRGRHRPVGELVQPHPTPPRQPRRPVTRRRRTPLPSQPHHHHRRGTRHGITNPPQNPGRSITSRLGSARSKPVNALVSTIFAQTSQEAVAAQYQHVIDALRDAFPSESPRC